MQKRRADNETMLDLAAQLQRKRELLRSDFNAISEEEKAELKKLLPDTVDNVRLILDINDIAEQYGIIIKNISVSADGNDSSISIDDSDTAIGRVSLGFSVSTTYDVYLEFLRDLEEALRIVDIRTLSISRSGEGSEFYNYGITLETYWLRSVE